MVERVIGSILVMKLFSMVAGRCGSASACAARGMRYLRHWTVLRSLWLPGRTGIGRLTDGRTDSCVILVLRKPDGDLGSRADAELVQDVFDVGLHRALGDTQRGGDFAVGGAACDQARDIHLPAAEALERGSRAVNLCGSRFSQRIDQHFAQRHFRAALKIALEPRLAQ